MGIAESVNQYARNRMITKNPLEVERYNKSFVNGKWYSPCLFERISENLCVIHCLGPYNEDDGRADCADEAVKYKEVSRIFLGYHECVVKYWNYHERAFCLAEGEGLTANYFSHLNILNTNELFEDWEFKYYERFFQYYTLEDTPYLETRLPVRNAVIKLIALYTAPVIESMSKIGLSTLSNYIIEKYITLVKNNVNVQSILTNIFGKGTDYCTGFKNAFGMNNYQLTKIDSLMLSNRSLSYTAIFHIIAFVKELFGRSNYREKYIDISAMDNNVFDHIVNVAINSGALSFQDKTDRLAEDMFYSQEAFNMLLPKDFSGDAANFLSNMFGMLYRKNIDANLYLDGIKDYNELSDDFRPADFDFHMKNESDLQRFRNGMAKLLIAQKMTFAKEETDKVDSNTDLLATMKSLDIERSKLEYSDDEYFIELPKKLSDLTMEGILQNICIGEYVEKHATGETTVYFLRKKSNPTAPFFAIEIADDGMGKYVRQIHGFANRWLGYNDESFASVPFVMRWLAKNKISCEEGILTSRAIGFSANTAGHRKLPII